MANLPTILLILAAISIGATVIAVLIAFRSQKEAESAIFPIVREQEAIRAQRARLSIFVWIAITALFLGGWLATLRLGLSPQAESVASKSPVGEPAAVAQDAAPTPMPTPEPSPTNALPETEFQPLTSEQALPEETEEPLLPTATPQPSQTPTTTATPPPSPTFTATPVPATATPTFTPLPPTATPTFTPPPTDTPTPVPTNTATPVGGIPLPTQSGRTPAPPGARMGPIEFAEDITEDMEPINPADRFTDGIAAIYALYPFSGIPQGVNFAVVWYKNGVEVAREESEWPYGEQAKSYSYLVPRGEGLYKLELYVNDTVMATDIFEVRK